MEDRQDISIDEMKDKLEMMGAKELWRAIEHISNWQLRIAYRQVYFMAGGSLD